MSKVAGPGLQSRIRRISAGCLSDKENSPLGVTRLRRLLKRKVKKAQNTTDSKIKNKTKVPKTDVWVNLKDGTKIKLCSTCATKKKNTSSEAQKTKDRIKLSNKSRDNVKDNNIKRTLRTPKIQTISSDSKLLSDNNNKSVVVKKESASKATKPKVTKKTRKDFPKTEIPVMNEAKQREKEVVDQNSIKQGKFGCINFSLIML
ncbi:PREDICTED: uncharacterized protein LOC105359515 [Ceratosolen solmsi marchali]|uniref:Uncharacterized protein LOC105359515 n=1 Tax=Ceratosolen solmsi marchali TaxID=326594 RepID=A0AAJ6VKU3_9HYME|nr:PREDICTED: uncharacterized protein LOC105359515 [Ceratosolen solmsi marchali]